MEEGSNEYDLEKKYIFELKENIEKAEKRTPVAGV